LFQVLVWMAEDHVEGEKVIIADVAVSRNSVDCESFEGIIEKQFVLLPWVPDHAPTTVTKKPFNLSFTRRGAVIVGLLDGKRNLSIRPLNDLSQLDAITEDFVREMPSIQILQRCSPNELNALAKLWKVRIASQVDVWMADDCRDQAETGRFCEFSDDQCDRIQLDRMFSAIVQIRVVVAEPLSAFVGNRQDRSFTSERNRSFGLVFCEAGPVTPIASDVVRT